MWSKDVTISNVLIFLALVSEPVGLAVAVLRLAHTTPHNIP
jgi:hypothetical protein